MKVKIPKEIRLLTHKYKIRFDTKELASAQAGGLTRHLYQEIILDNVANPKSEVDQIFLHEFLHVIERHLCVKIDDADVERISEGLAELLFTSLGIEFDWSLIT